MKRCGRWAAGAVAWLATTAALAQGPIPAEVRLGQRVEAVRRAWPVASMVVVADSERAYLEALGAWSPERRFPVLLDDGSDRAREDAARFIRAFGPERVRLYSSSEAARPVGRAEIEAAVASAWGADGTAALREQWARMKFSPPGVVVASETDAAWAGAAALAAGHGQPIVWTASPRGRLGGVIDDGDLRSLRDAIEAAVRTGPWSWAGTGDEIDVVTLCLNAPTKVKDAGVEGTLALTDVLGRGADGERWAWSGMVFGSAAESAYRAMCSLFLQPDSAWLFNGYSRGGAYAAYAPDGAAERLEEAGLTVHRSGRPAGGRADWGLATIGGVRAGLVCVNSSGQRRWFELAPGRCDGVDTPLLVVPSAVHFIHSFSAQNLDDAASIAPAWLAQGAFVYYGSVDEPFLRAFVTPTELVTRLLAAAPFGAAARRGGPVWKLNYFGDPLYTLGPAAAGFGGAVDFAGLRDVGMELRGALETRAIARASRLLCLLGRDGDVVDLAVASSDPEAASAGVLAAVRMGRVEAVGALYGRMPERLQRDGRYADPVWQLIEPVIDGEIDGATARLLGTMVRRSRFERDASLAARALSRAEGPASASALLTRLMEEAPTEGDKRALARQLTRY